jgi:hypothetical protein
VPQGIDAGGDILPAVERLQRQGLLEAGDPNVIAQPNVQEHTLSASAAPGAASAVLTSAHASLSSCVHPAAEDLSAVEALQAGDATPAGVAGLPITAAAGAALRAAGAGAVVVLLAGAVTGMRRRRTG